MNIRIEKFNFEDPVQIDALTKWDCDKELYHLVTPVFFKGDEFEYPNPVDVVEKYKNPDFSKGVYVIFDGEKPVGNLSIQIDPPQLFKKAKGTSWLGLIIGEKDYWGKGVAKMAMKFFENESLRLGLNRIELGTFEFNTRAIHFYTKLGYKEIARLKHFTYYQGRSWDDIRMEKVLR